MPSLFETKGAPSLPRKTFRARTCALAARSLIVKTSITDFEPEFCKTSGNQILSKQTRRAVLRGITRDGVVFRFQGSSAHDERRAEQTDR